MNERVIKYNDLRIFHSTRVLFTLSITSASYMFLYSFIMIHDDRIDYSIHD